MAYFWYFLGYGFLGYLLEKLFAALTHAEHRVRKGFLLAPVCPVYGLAMCAVLALGADRIGPLWELALLCSITATTAEYAVHLFCDAVTNTVLLCLGIDALWSTGVLLRWGDIDLLAPSRLRRKYRTA